MTQIEAPLLQMADIDPSAGRSTDLTTVWRRLLGRKWRIAGVTLVFVLAGATFVALSQPEFAAEGSLYTDGLKQSANPGNDPIDATASSYMNYLATFQSISDIESQVDILLSPDLLQHAVLASGINTSITNGLDTPLRYWVWKIKDHGDIAAYRPSPDDLTSHFASFSDPSVVKQTYHVVFGTAGAFRIMQANNVVLDGVLGQPAAGNGLSLVLDAANPGFVPSPGATYDLAVTAPAVTAAALAGTALTVTPGGTATLPSDVINISLRTQNPYQSELFVNELMNLYIATIVSWNSTEAGSMVSFIDSRLSDVRNQLTLADDKLAAYQQQTGILSPPDNAKDAIDQESQYEVQRTQLQVEVVALQQSAKALSESHGDISPFLVNQTTDVALSQVAETLAEANATLQSMRVRFIAGSPDVQAQQQLVSQLQKAISGMITNDLSQARDRLNTLNGLIAQFQNKVSTMPAQTREVVKLTRASDVLGQLYVLLMQKQQEAELSQEATVSSTRVLTTAQLPLTSSRPAAAIILAFSFVLGLLAACIFALVRGEMTDTLESENDLRRRSPALVFGVIPRFRPAAAFFDPAAAPASVVESFRRLRINLNNILGAEKSRTILLNSAGGGENTKVVAVTLAKSLADDGKNVVLLDADLRRGGLSEYLGLQSARGLSEWLVSGEQSSVQRLVGQRFAVLPAGQSPSHPADLLSSPNLSIILKGILSTCDFVIIDSSPFPAVSDAATLAKQADLVISVIEVGVSSKRLVDVHQSAIVPLAQQYGLIIANAAAPRRADTYAYPQDLKTSPAPAPGENRPASEPGGRWAPAKG